MNFQTIATISCMEKGKPVYTIKLDNHSTPINNRKDIFFPNYFNRIWEDLNE